MKPLKDKTIVITGSSRGIGRAMALKFAAEGANIVVAAKSAKPHSKLPGTIHSVAAEVVAAGGQGLAVQVDVRDAEQVAALAEQAVARFGGIDVLINNAGAISLTPVEKTPLKRYDLMQQINSRAVFLCAQTLLPHLKKAANPHILSLSPPVNLAPQWLAGHAPYTLSKYGMTLLSLGMAQEFRPYGIAVNTLWPRTIIATAAIEFAVGDRGTFRFCRAPEIMADAAYQVITTPDLSLSGQTLIDEAFLRERGISDFDGYRHDPEFEGDLYPDLFIDTPASDSAG
ncbi:MAG: NAD(P)-dependent oxidoreductase [Desulfobacterales bacterium]